MNEPHLYAIVLRLAALRAGALNADHGDQARAALLGLIRQGDQPLAQMLHDLNEGKPYAISLVQGGKRGKDDALHFGDGDTAEWRFTLLFQATFEALVEKYLRNNAQPHVRLGVVPFAITDVFISGSHRESGHASIAQLTARWNVEPETLDRAFTLDFRSPTAFSLGRDPATQEQRYRSQPDPRTLFSALRKRWVSLGGFDAGDEFDAWVGRSVEAEAQRIQMRRVWVKNHWIQGFSGRVRFVVYGNDRRWLPYLYLLADVAFWTGVGYQTTRGMGQVRRIFAE